MARAGLGFALAALAVGAGCSPRAQAAGRYTHARAPEEWIELGSDGSYHFARGTNDHRGRYDVAGAEITLWYPSDGTCTTGGEGPAVPSPGLCAFRALVRDDRLTFFRLKGGPVQPTREMGEEFVLRALAE